MSSLTGAAVLLASGAASAQAGKPTVAILATGGTIAGKQPDPNAPGYKAGSFSIKDLETAVPQLKDVATISGQQVANIGSQNMHDAVWLKLLKAATETLAKPEVAGAVVTHGTDTIEETSYFLNLTLKSDKPVVLVGAMRPATALSADGPMNIYNGVVVAGSPQAKGRGVLVLMNDEIHYAAEITKTDTTHPNAMKSPNRGLAGVCDTGKCRFFSPTEKRHTTKSEFSISNDVTELPDVAIVYAHANLSSDLIEAAIKAGARGIVIAGVGDGNMTDPALDALGKAAKDGIVVVRSARVGKGVVKRNIEVDDDKLGFVAAQELNPQKARILLQLALMKTKDPGKIQKMFMEY
ncbi:MAG: type II asparaginase [Alphaproteobacteria bacterium]|nr:type II asparaginase [Alphaproteobacteria bacterium]